MGGIVSSPFVRLPLAALTYSTSEFAYKKPLQFGFEGNPAVIGDSSDPYAAAKAGAGATALMAPIAAAGSSSADGTDADSRRRAAVAAEQAPTSATSLLTDEADPGGIKRKRLLGD